jgi:predicted nucleic acid-binding protein
LSYLIDTNVLSELRRREPDAQVVAWMQARPRQSLYLSVLSLGEIREGIEGVAEPAFRQTLTDWLEVELRHYFVGRLLDIDEAVADRWGRVQAASGRSLPVIDGLLAATACLGNTHTALAQQIKAVPCVALVEDPLAFFKTQQRHLRAELPDQLRRQAFKQAIATEKAFLGRAGIGGDHGHHSQDVRGAIGPPYAASAGPKRSVSPIVTR